MNTLRTILDLLGYFATAIVIVSTVVGIVLWLRGIAPALVRLGNGLARRKIAIFAKDSMLKSLESMLLDSKLFRKGNIIEISDEGDIGRSEEATLFLVYWPDWKGSIGEILRHKVDGTALIIYAPQDQGFVPAETIAELNLKRNVILVNFRGRLLNDIVASMITTSYEKK